MTSFDEDVKAATARVRAAREARAEECSCVSQDDPCRFCCEVRCAERALCSILLIGDAPPKSAEPTLREVFARALAKFHAACSPPPESENERLRRENERLRRELDVALAALEARQAELRKEIAGMQDFARRWREASIEVLVERDEEIAALEQKVTELEENVAEALERGKWTL